MRMKPYCCAVLAAAGNSVRMGQCKQFLPLLGVPAMVYTLRAFELAGGIEEIILVCKLQDRAPLEACISKAGVTKPVSFVQGGATRQQSVAAGVRACCSKTDFVVIHDAARALITPQLIEQAIHDAVVYGAAALAVPVKDTVKIADESGFVTATPNRNALWAVQTPQVFLRTGYLHALELAEKDRKDYTDDCQLLENAGVKVHLCLGSYENLKLTTKEDIAVAEALLKNREG